DVGRPPTRRAAFSRGCRRAVAVRTRRARAGAASGARASRRARRRSGPRAWRAHAAARRALERDDRGTPLDARCAVVTADAVWAALEEIPDPEIPVVSLVDLGVVRDVQIDGEHVRIEFTPTFLGCPALEVMKRAMEDKVTALGAEPEVA